MMDKMEAWGAKEAAGPDGRARSEWQHMTLEMRKPRDMIVKMEETVGIRHWSN